ncbi:MAG: GNAT family N-acetyltransferase [Promethearchaeota archaeon]|nr:MAG: GNAT family N-acetyltransferase [Candidatus Lokiarchaeota archaeon]
MILIRELRKEDLEALKVLLNELNNVLDLKHKINECTIDSVYDAMDKYPEIYSNHVSVENNKILGFLSLIFYKSFLHEGGTALINELIVAEKYRNKGIGKQLIHKAFELAKKSGMDEIEVGTELSNTIAQTFYKKIGFNEEFKLLAKVFKT